ncbi:MAG: hypothetical protein R6V56_01565 [Lentisphaeria bacterium]
MNTIIPFLKNATTPRPKAAILLSGSGSNAEKIIQKWRQADAPPFDIATLFTDAPERSRARELAETYELSLIENDIRRFYRDHGQTRMTIATPEGQNIREKWTAAARNQLTEKNVAFCIMAGFVPLTNLTVDFPSLNVHPGDLTYLKNGRRHLVGLHTVPVERAILEGLEAMRSSVIIAQPYTGKGGEMDSGPILGISDEVEIDLQGNSLDELRASAADRPERRPKGGYKDELERVADYNQTRLKEEGDWVVFPQVIFDFAAGRFGTNTNNELFFYASNSWVPVRTVIYGKNQREILLRREEPQAT